MRRLRPTLVLHGWIDYESGVVVFCMVGCLLYVGGGGWKVGGSGGRCGHVRCIPTHGAHTSSDTNIFEKTGIYSVWLAKLGRFVLRRPTPQCTTAQSARRCRVRTLSFTRAYRCGTLSQRHLHHGLRWCEHLGWTAIYLQHKFDIWIQYRWGCGAHCEVFYGLIGVSSVARSDLNSTLN